MKCFPRLIVPVLFALAAIGLFGQGTEQHQSEISLESLSEQDLNAGGGTFYYLIPVANKPKQCVLGTIGDSSEMGLRLSGKLHRLKLVSRSFVPIREPAFVKIGDRIIETYSDSKIEIRVDRTIDEIGKESMSFHGTLIVKYGNRTWKHQVIGVGLG